MILWTTLRNAAIVTGTLALGALAACGGSDGAPIRATLVDEQVLYGTLRTEILVLDGGLGKMEIPLSHIGEVLPVEGGQLENSDGHVKIWLRNGSELVGRWDNPELGMGIDVGGEQVKVDLPVGDLERVQTQGDELWPEGLVYRVRTTHGDDFLVDAEASRVVMENDLGVFSPFLSECRSVRPIEDPDGEWRIELDSGTVLIGNLADDELTLALPLGPDQVVVPLAILDSMEQQSWYFARAQTAETEVEKQEERMFRPSRRSSGAGSTSWKPWDGEPAEASEAPATDGPSAAPVDEIAIPEPASAGASADGWFERDALEQTKRSSD